jgi:4-amino-4-deoxy-L-arabinose transferase-like glycosyltransferase
MVEGMPERIGRRDVLVLGILGLAGIGIPLWLSAAAGAIGVPSNDDWVYMRAASSLFRAGTIDMPGHNAAAVGQLVMVQPLLWLSGGNPWAFTTFGLVMALIGAASTYLLARRFVRMGSAVLVVLLVLAFPGFVRETASFMTDVPAYALAALCLLLGTRWLQGDGGRVTLVASLGVGLLGVSIREFAIAAPVAILVAAWARSSSEQRVWLAGVSGMLAVGVACVLVVAASTPGHATLVTPGVGQLGRLGPAFATLAAVLLPAAALAMGRRIATFNPRHILIGAGLVCLVAAVPSGPLVGNLWWPNGFGGDFLLSGTRDAVFGASAWGLSGQLALFAGILVTALALRWGQNNLARVSSSSIAVAPAIRIARSREAPLILFLVAYCAELAVFASVGSMFDRYLYPMVPAAAILLLGGVAQPPRSGLSRPFAIAAFAWLAASAFVIAANSFAYDAARYRAGEAAVAMGYEAGTVDAGYEWVGYHATGAETGANTYSVNWYEAAWPSFRPCAVVSNSPLDIGALRLIRVDRSAYMQYLFFGPAEPLYLYGALLDGCPQLPAAVRLEGVAHAAPS